VGAFIYVLEKGDISLKEKVAHELAEIGEKTVPLLMPLLKHPDPNVTYAAVETLSMMGDRVVDDLIKALDDDHPEVRGYRVRSVDTRGLSVR